MTSSDILIFIRLFLYQKDCFDVDVHESVNSVYRNMNTLMHTKENTNIGIIERNCELRGLKNEKNK